MLSDKIPSEKFNQLKDTFWVTYKILKLVWRTDKLLFLLNFLVGVLPPLFVFLNTYIYKLVIDFVVSAINNGVSDYSKLYLLISLRFASYLVQELVNNSSEYIDRVLWAKFPIVITALVLEKLSSLDIEYFENSKFKELLEKVRQNYENRPQQLVSNVMYGISSLVRLLIAAVAVANLSWALLGALLILAIPSFINQIYRSKRSWGIWDGNSPFRKKYWYLITILEDYRWIKEVKIFKLADKFLHEVKNIQIKFLEDNKKVSGTAFKSGVLIGWLDSGVYIFVETYIIFQALLRKITIGDIGFYTQIVSQFNGGLNGVFNNFNRIFENSLYIKSIFDLLELESLIKSSQNPIKLELNKTPKIEFKDVSFSYPDSDKKILNNFNLVIEPGDKVAFVGENGAGKSTIIKLLLRFYDVSSGEILINGINIKELDLQNWYQLIGVLFQDFNRYEHTASENIQFGNIDTKAELEEIIDAAKSSGAHTVIEKLNKKYDSNLGKTFEEGEELSGGQWQKIALARAFFRNAPILVLDEPTASIDAKAESEIFTKVEKLSKSKTVIIISHRFSTVRNADKIFVLDDGKVIESGSHTDLMKQDGTYAKLFKLQAKGYQ